jgi:hypothetical protein
MKKKFDTVEMKRKIQSKIYEEIKDLTLDEEIAYFNKAGERFQRDMEKLRSVNKTTPQAKSKKKAESTSK